MQRRIINFILLFTYIITLCSCAKDRLLNQNQETASQEVEVAILMPTTGAFEGVGAEYTELIKSGFKDGLQGNVSITSYDCSSASSVLESMNKIIAKNTKIILGPLTSPITSAIASKAESAGIIVISLSNNPAIAGGHIYVFGHAPSKQIKPLFDYFFENNYKNFITLLPSGNYSQNVSKIIQNTVIQNHATFVRAEFYTEDPESINNAIKIVSDNIDNINEVEDEHLRKTVIYLGDDPEVLSIIFDKIRAVNLDKKAVIAGDNRIDIDYSPFVDIVFTSSLNSLNGNLKERATTLGVSNLTFMHALSYDLGRMSAEFIGKNFNKSNFLARINSQTYFNGISGKVHFIDNIAQRKYDVISKENGNYKAGYNTIANKEE